MSMLFRERDGRWPAELLHAAAPVGIGASGQVHSFAGSGGPGTLLLVSPRESAWINGEPLIGGLWVLAHRDEIAIGGQRAYFSIESRPATAEFVLPGDGRRPRCPVCRVPIEPGQMVVSCPGCGRAYHQIPATEQAQEKHCWTYLPACRFCQHPTDLSGEQIWTPGQLEERYAEQD